MQAWDRTLTAWPAQCPKALIPPPTCPKSRRRCSIAVTPRTIFARFSGPTCCARSAKWREGATSRPRGPRTIEQVISASAVVQCRIHDSDRLLFAICASSELSFRIVIPRGFNPEEYAFIVIRVRVWLQPYLNTCHSDHASACEESALSNQGVANAQTPSHRFHYVLLLFDVVGASRPHCTGQKACRDRRQAGHRCFR